jgi:hypothetical protein
MSLSALLPVRRKVYPQAAVLRRLCFGVFPLARSNLTKSRTAVVTALQESIIGLVPIIPIQS